MNLEMIQRYHDLEADDPKLRRLTGLKRSEFELLHGYFREAWNAYFAEYTLDGVARLRQASVRKNSIFGDTHDALLFGLIYLNGNLRQDQLASFFGIDQPKASKYLSLIQRILLQVIEATPRAVPKRKLDKFLDMLSS